MGTHSNLRRLRAETMLRNRGKRIWEELSPRKPRKGTSPRKKRKEKEQRESDIEDPEIKDASSDPFSMSETTDVHSGPSETDASSPPRDASPTPSLPNKTDASSPPCDASPTPSLPNTSPVPQDASDDPFLTCMQSFKLAGAAVTERPSSMLGRHAFVWKLPKPPKPRPRSPRPTPEKLQPPCQKLHAPQDPRDAASVPEIEDELLAMSLQHDDQYPGPAASCPFLEHMHSQATRPGKLREAPNLGEAQTALDCVKEYLRGDLRGTDLFGRRGMGYKDQKITMCLETYSHWGASARFAAAALGRGVHCARVLAALSRQFILDRQVLNVNPYGEWIKCRRVIIWYHDESIFYAHDRRRETWYHKDSDALPYRKGEGYSFMVADFFSPDFGWLRNPDDLSQNARRSMRPGKNRDGYFTSEEVLEQANTACDLVQELWPEFDHIFVYDNATTHKKRPEGSLSARAMPKGTSGMKKGKEEANFLVEVNKRDAEGKLVYDTKGNLVKDKIKMTGAHFDGHPHDLYFPDDHPKYSGKFKGMKLILEERGMHEEAKLARECLGFKYANRTHRFGDAYFNHKLSGKQAAWAAKKYSGHRTYPASILAELDKAGIH
ncbi:unnamed protein product [Mycena citricolor]|uniref:Uncharacterized protein n=1 Tax=Mycena citricolor TaxID=2018698 RepID=A0AAD2Q796_9AGAR|nr:unnamed protein product [Mycena citricolor]